MTVILNHPDITITSCVPVATTIAGYTATLAYSLTPIQQITYVVQYYVAPSAIISSNVLGSAAAIDVTDLTPSNNIDSVHAIVTGSYDPNEKQVYPAGDITPAFVASATPLEYTVNFQNTGTDTAFVVVIRDTISTYLNLSTFKYISSSSPVQIDFYGNEVWFRFYNINLVDSTTDEPMSHGFVKYSIVPNSTCSLGDQIDNTAYIYFDYNTPIVTNTTHTLIANPVGINENEMVDESFVYPNPTNSGFVNVKSNALIQKVAIYNLTGELVKEVQGNSTNKLSLSTNGMEAGIYFVNIKTDKGSSVHKVIKIN